jgi:hypothetical protein
MYDSVPARWRLHTVQRARATARRTGLVHPAPTVLGGFDPCSNRPHIARIPILHTRRGL